MVYTLGHIAQLVDGVVEGDSTIPIRGVSGIREAEEGDITFLDSARYKSYLKTTRASAVIVRPGGECPKPAIRIDNPYRAFLKTLYLFSREIRDLCPEGIHPAAFVHPGASLGKNIAIGAKVVVDQGVRIGNDCTIMHGAVIMADCRIGDDCVIYPNVVIREDCVLGDRVIVQPGVVVGSDGFGFYKDGKENAKIPQVGIVVVEDDVELGANVTIDRATAGETRIKKGVKLDNLVHVAHNVSIGDNTLIAAQSGISGSTQVGKDVTLAGQSGIVGHIRIGDGSTVGAQAGVTRSVPDGDTVSGYPARPHDQAKKSFANVQRLPKLMERMKELEEKMAELEAKLEGGSGA